MFLAACRTAGDGSAEFAPTAQGQAALSSTAVPAAKQCAIPLPSGPPAKPRRLVAFGSDTAWNVGRGIGRGVVSGVGVGVAGPVGGVVAGGVAATIRSEYDLRGTWTATDGSQDCGCSISVSATTRWKGGSANKGKLSAGNCSNPMLATAHDWRLDDSLTGYEAELLLYAANGNRIAVLKRDSADYYSGALSDGTPITLWR
ncbi:AprI/Inh family metalloprotease inhibitor [Mesorhizobium sp. J18]|uniref:AprI/Inh family metalloprotease inhibitor n=1 Tax=Mesorhizobium sp. J18 TaxID=935263 RepID=UPI0011A2E5A4|nr:AprI/Inh family metalloprotease inhibitor [Mesorhizobium sp. J18]